MTTGYNRMAALSNHASAAAVKVGSDDDDDVDGDDGDNCATWGVRTDKEEVLMFIIGRIALYKYGSRAGGQAGAGAREGRRGPAVCCVCRVTQEPW